MCRVVPANGLDRERLDRRGQPICRAAIPVRRSEDDARKGDLHQRGFGAVGDVGAGNFGAWSAAAELVNALPGGKVFEFDMFGGGFALSFEGDQFSFARFQRTEGEAFLFFVASCSGRVVFFWAQSVGGECRTLTSEQAVAAADLAVEGSPGGVDEAGGIGKRTGPILHQAVQAIVLTHVFEEVFLIPTGEHGGGRGSQIAAVIGAQDGALMAAFVEPAQLSHPQAIAQAGATFGEAQGGDFAIGVSEGVGAEFVLRPVGAGMSVIGENGEALLLEAQEEARGVALAVKDEGEAVKEGIGGEEIGGGLAGDLGEQARHDVCFESFL